MHSPAAAVEQGARQTQVDAFARLRQLRKWLSGLPKWLVIATLFGLCVAPTFISYQGYLFGWDDSDYLQRSILVSQAFWSWDLYKLRSTMVGIKPPALHHAEDATVLLNEARRVARKSIILKDHTMDGLLAYETLGLMDWVGNAHHGVALPYNYWPERRWYEVFAEVGLQLTRWEARIPLYPFPASLIFGHGLHFIAVLVP